MKQFCNGKMRTLLGLVLIISLMLAVCPQASAVSHQHLSVSPQLIAQQSWPDGSLQSVTLRLNFPNSGLGRAYGKIALHRSEPQFDCYTRYSNDGSQWPASIDTGRDTTFIAMETGSEFLWTSGGTFDRTISFAQGALSQGTYEIYLWTRCDTFGSTVGVYPDAFLTKITVGSGGNVTVGGNPVVPPVHVHQWVPATSGLGSKKAITTITCTGCSENLTVSLNASDVTLPGDVFTAQISVSQNGARAASPLTVSQTPGYKYSASGSGFEPINPSSFTPKQGIYQASILILDGNTQVENLYVTYTVSDPVVTAATGDNRPIEVMFVGLVCFTVMAAIAFIVDSKRKARF